MDDLFINTFIIQQSTASAWQQIALFTYFSCLQVIYCARWAFYQICKIAGCACAGNAGSVFPSTDFKGNRWSPIPVCITTRASRTCYDACRDRKPAVAGTTFSAFPAHAQPAICVSGKRGPCEWHTFIMWQCTLNQAHDTPIAEPVLLQATYKHNGR